MVTSLGYVVLSGAPHGGGTDSWRARLTRSRSESRYAMVPVTFTPSAKGKRTAVCPHGDAAWLAHRVASPFEGLQRGPDCSDLLAHGFFLRLQRLDLGELLVNVTLALR